MSDTVKLVIEIPKEAKQAFDKSQSNDLKGGYYDHGGIIGKAIQNGIPLDKDSERAETQAYFAGEAYGWEQGRKALIDDVKAEIDKAQEPYKTSTAYDEGVKFGLMLAYQTIEKYKAESEVNPNE